MMPRRRHLLALAATAAGAGAGLAWSLPLAAAEPGWPDRLLIATASAGGTYQVYGDALARLLTRELKLTVLTRASGGPAENIGLLDRGEVQLAFVTMGVAFQAWNGTGAWAGSGRLRSALALFPMYDTPFHFVLPRASTAAGLASMAGKRIGIGPAGGTGDAYLPRFLETLGTEAVLERGSWEALAEQLRAGSLDMLAVAAGAPFPAIAGLEAASLVRLLELPAAEIAALRQAMPELSDDLIAAGTYPSLNQAYHTVGMYNFAVAGADMPIDLAYAILEAVFDHRDELVAAHPAAVATRPANFVHNQFLPYHPGAGRWFANHAAPGIVQGD